MSDQELSELYWKFQKQVHTNPKLRTYLHKLTEILQKRKISPVDLNRVGLELEANDEL
jgi:hypothetical protein